MSVKPKAPVHEEYVGICATAMPCVSDSHASCMVCAAIFFGPLALWFGACFDENGCNCNTFLFGWGMSMLPIIG